MYPHVPDSFLTGSSKLATIFRLIPKTPKNSFQNVCRSACSRVSPAQSLAKAVALWRISFQEIGIGGVLGVWQRIDSGLSLPDGHVVLKVSERVFLPHSPKGAAQLSPGREPWVNVPKTTRALKGRHNHRPTVSPLQGFMILGTEHPGLTPWAKLCRPVGAKISKKEVEDAQETP